MVVLTHNICKLIKSLDERKYRKKEGAFKAEGTKCVVDTMDHFELRYFVATSEWLETHADIASSLPDDKLVKAPRRDMAKMSSLVTPPEVIAVYDLPQWELNNDAASSNLVLALDTIQDPGNLGTIIRVSDWFGITDIICTPETADCFSPKVIQATMGSISRVRLHYCNLVDTIAAMHPTAVYGTFLDGDSISDAKLGSSGIIVIGNEGKGISSTVEATVTHRLLIPSYPVGRPTGESLNAAVATAITLAKFRGV